MHWVRSGDSVESLLFSGIMVLETEVDMVVCWGTTGNVALSGPICWEFFVYINTEFVPVTERALHGRRDK